MFTEINIGGNTNNLMLCVKLQKDSLRLSGMLCGLGWLLVTHVFEERIGTVLKVRCWKLLVDVLSSLSARLQ
jgi:hypothetical protein